MEKRKVAISLKTDLSQQAITQALRDFTSNNTTEIVSNLKKKKIPFKDKIMRRHTVTNIGPIDFNQFDTISINADSPNASMNIQCLLEENYTFYINKLRRLYPYFKFNHYSKYFEQIKHNKKDQHPNEAEYNLEDRLDKINIDKQFQCQSREYKIEASILEQKKEGLQLSAKTYDSQIECVELEFGRVFKNCTKIENYINNNLHYKKEIDNVLNDFITKQNNKEYFKQHYLVNSSKLIIAMIAKKNKVNLLNPLKQVNNAIHLINKMKDNTIIENNGDNILSNVKNSINSLRKIKDLRFITYIEREIQKYNDQSEIKHIEQFIQIITTTMHQCFVFDNTLEISNEKGTPNQQFKANYDLDSIQKYNNNYIDASKHITFYFLILLPNKAEMLNQILNVFSIVITENYEIPIIIDKLKIVFINEIINISDNLKKRFYNIGLITALSKAYFILIENYNYLLETFNKNFAFSPKNFSELSKYIKNETKNKLFPLINTMIIEIITHGDVEELLFTKDKVQEMVNDYLTVVNISLDEYYSQYENDFIFQFFEIQIKRIKDCISKEKWVQMPKMKKVYQKMINTLFMDFHEISKEELYATNTLSNSNEEDINYLQVKESNLIAMESTLIVIEFLFATYKLLFYLHKKYSQTIILQLCKWIIYYLNQLQSTIINSQGEVNNKKITEKDFMLVNATIVTLKHIFFSFITYFLGENDNAINETINGVLKKINEMHLRCVETMNDVSTQV